MLTISAIIPTCERPVFLRRALESIVAQELVPVEIIVVDDSGNENTTRTQLSFRDFGCVRIIANSHRKGPSGARNSGADIATGDLLAFLDDDDEWLSAYLSEAHRLFESNLLDVACTDLLCRFEDGIDRAGKSAPEKLQAENFLTRNPGLVGSNLTMRRSLYLEIGGFDESLPAGEDTDLGVRLSLREDLKYERLAKKLVRLHQHNGPQLSTGSSNAICAGMRRFYELHAHRMNEQQQDEFRDNLRRFWGIDEHGNRLSPSQKAQADSLLRDLKAWLDRKRVALKKTPPTRAGS
jgi:glycosyltransferase involved in cell wall biosynthesis